MADPPSDRNAFWRAGIGVFFSTFHAHQALAAPWSVAKYTNSEAARIVGGVHAEVDRSDRGASSRPSAPEAGHRTMCPRATSRHR